MALDMSKQEAKPIGDISAPTTMAPPDAHVPKKPSWQELFEVAAPQQGCFSADQAAAVGFSSQLLSKHVGGRLERLHRGIYRLTQFPPSEQDQQDLIVAWLWSERQGVFSHETALLLQDLSREVFPAHIHLTLPASWAARRVQAPSGVTLYFADLSPKEKSWVGSVPVTAPARTLNDLARAFGDAAILADAAKHAVVNKMVSTLDIDDVIFYLKNSGGPPGPYLVRPSATENLTGVFKMMAVSGRCLHQPASDWRLEAEQWANECAGKLLETKYFPFGKEMYLSLVWPEHKVANMPDWSDVRNLAAKKFGWVE